MNSPKTVNDFIRDLHAPRLLAALLGTLLLATTPALAEDGYDRKDTSFGRAGAYLSGGVGGAVETFDNTGGIDFDSAFLIGARLGYRANRFLALEGTVDYSVTGFEFSSGANEAEFEALLATGTLKLYPIDGRLQPFLLGGGGVLRIDPECKSGGTTVACPVSEEMDFAGRIGGGIDVYVFKNLAVSGEVAYVIPTGDLEDASFVTFGAYAMIRF